MKDLRIFALAIAAALLLVAIPAHAHHGTTAYDNAKTLKLTGTVTSFTWVNPHASLAWDAKGENGRSGALDRGTDKSRNAHPIRLAS